MRRTDRKVRKMILQYILYGCFFLLFVCGFFIYQSWSASHQSEKEYEEVKEEAVVEKEEQTSEESEESDEEQMELPITVDFAPLLKANSDLVAWIYFKDGEINYPVVQTDDNSTYLNRTFEGESSAAGCIFIDMANEKDFSDTNTFFYGHNMKNGSIFGSLKYLYRDLSKLTDPNIYVYLPDGKVNRYEIFAVYLTKSGSDKYKVPEKKDLAAYQEEAAGESGYEPNALEDHLGEDMITLSTCYGSAGTSTRLLIQAVLVQTGKQPVKADDIVYKANNGLYKADNGLPENK